jgi:hypothetical protein
MVPSSSIVIIVDGKCLACGGFTLGETVRLRNFEFITDYFGGLSLSPRGVTKTPLLWAQPTVGHLPYNGPRLGTPPRSSSWCQLRKEALATFPLEGVARGSRSLAPTTTTTRKENTSATTMFSPRTVALQLETNFPFERCHAHTRDSRRKPVLSIHPPRCG